MATEVKTGIMIALAVAWYVTCHLLSAKARKAEEAANADASASALFSWLAPMGVIGVFIAIVLRWV